MSSWPVYASDEVEAVQRVLLSGRVNYWNGEEGRVFEREMADYCGMSYGIAVANGTLALELALYALGIGQGDEVVVAPRTFIASASSIVMRGARPVFADVDRESGNITPATVEPVLTERTRAILPVHLAGWPCDMAGLLALARQYGLYLIEDCAQAHGAAIVGQPVGSFGDAAAFSFCTDKIMSTGGEGGMLLLRDEAAWQRAWAYKDHGKAWDAVYQRDHPPGFRWLHESFGTNWRMTEIQAAIGRCQLAKLDHWVERRREHAALLDEGLAGVPALRIPQVPAAFRHAYYKYYAFVEPSKLRAGWDRDAVVAAIQAEGVTCLHGGCSEVYREKAFEHKDMRPARRLPIARELGETSLMLLTHPTLTQAELESVVVAIRKILEIAIR